MISTTGILEISRSNAGSYIQHDAGQYKLMYSSGIAIIEDTPQGKILIEPTHQMIDDLAKEQRITIEGSKYRLS
jgi:hypothetical protein